MTRCLGCSQVVGLVGVSWGCCETWGSESGRSRWNWCLCACSCGFGLGHCSLLFPEQSLGTSRQGTLSAASWRTCTVFWPLKGFLFQWKRTETTEHRGTPLVLLIFVLEATPRHHVASFCSSGAKQRDANCKICKNGALPCHGLHSFYTGQCVYRKI